ncbi:MAG: two-component regulator propeller domain-containing protein [Acidobacteriaceae bacterium]
MNLARSVVVCFLLSLLAICPARALDPTSHISQYGHTAWRVQDGYFGSQPYAIAQTKDGYIWVGTRDGLFRFDGVKFVRWSSLFGEKLPSSFVISLLGARDGSLWIGTDAGLDHWVNNHLIVYPKGEGWYVVSILEDREGRIWIDRARSGDRTHPLCQVLATEIRCYGHKDGLDTFGSGPLLQDASGNLWVGGNTTLVRWREGKFQVYRPKGLISNAGQGGVEGLAAAPDGSLWVGMMLRGRGAGLQRMADGVLKPFVAPGLNGETLIVQCMTLDRENSLWVGTTEGIYRIRGAEVDHFGDADGLSSNAVYQIFEDREGNLWVLTSQGVDMFRDLRVKSISIFDGRSEGQVQSILATRDGRVLVGTSRLQVLGTDGVSSELGRALKGNMVTSLLEDHAGHLWVGMDNTLWVDEGGGFRPISRPDGSPVGMVTGIAEDSENNIWIESLGPPGELMRIRDLAVQQEFPAPEMPLARKLVADPQGGIWLGLVSGDLARYRSGQLTTFAFGSHPRSRVGAMEAGSDGSILGATDFGVIGWRDGKRQILTARNGLPCDSVNALIEDNERDQWVYVQCGLVEIPKSEMSQWWEHPEARLKLRVFDALDGVRPGFGNFNNSARAPDGRLWFANGSVVQVVDPAQIAGNAVPPPVYVGAVIADRRSYPIQGAIRLPALTRDLEIDYTALSYAVPQKVLFRYMLEGRDTAWQDAGTRREAFYTNLGPRHYRFRVIACNEDGVWNNVGAVVEFAIAPAWFQTWWFFALCAGAALLVLWVLYRMRVRQVANTMSARFDDRLAERTRIARDFHDTLLQTIQGSKLVADSALKQSPDAVRMQRAMEQLSVWLGRATEEGRAALNSLRTSTTETNDLAEAFRRSIEECRIHSYMEASFSVVGAVHEMHPIVRDEVYRIGYEAIHNACVHSQAARLQVELTYAEDLMLRVRDNGIGIDPGIVGGGKEGHFGLQGMRERAGRIMSKLTVETSRPSGTEIKLIVPGSIIYRTTISGSRKLTLIQSLLKRMSLKSDSSNS